MKHPTDKKELTPREKLIFALLEDGLTNKEIASKLSLAEKTIKFHNTHIYQKLETRRNDIIRRREVPNEPV